MLQRLEDRVVLSWTPLAAALTTEASPNYCTPAEVSTQVPVSAQNFNAFAAAYHTHQALDWTQGDAGNAAQLKAAGAVVDQAFVAGAPDTASIDAEAIMTLHRRPDATTAATASSSTVPAPFWRKVGDQPTFAPDWYANKGAVTREVYYDARLTSAQNGALLQQALSRLSPGDHVRIHAGTYSVDSYFVITATGTADRPITIEGAPGEQVIITRSNTSQNAVNIDQTQYLIMEGLTIRGGSTGLKVMGVNNFMLHDVEIWDTANNAIAANSHNTSYLYFIDNHIHDTGGHGEGFYLGADNGSLITHHSYVIGNYIHDLRASDVDQGDGIEIKDQSYAVTIKYNFVQNTRYPGIIVYRTGRGMTDRNVIEENVILHSDDVGIQATADAIIRNNLIVTNGTAFYSKPRVTNPQNLTVVNNTFVSGGNAVKVYSWEASNTFANNAIYSSTGQYIPTGTGAAQTTGNVQLNSLNAFANLNMQGTALDARPAVGSPLIGAARTAYMPVLDLNGQTRTTEADAGAVDYGAGQTTPDPVPPTEPLPPTQTASKLFDFGTDASPVAAGQARVSDMTWYNSAAGYGWLNGTVGSRDRGGPDAVKRDFNFTYSGAMSFGADLPAGSYQVTIVVGDEWYGATGTQVLLEGRQVDTLSRAAGEYLTKTYLVDVTDGQLTLTLGSGSSGGALINSLAIASGSTTPTPAPGPTPGIVVTPASGLTTSESGSSASFSVVLSSQPTSNVVVGLSSSDSSEGSVSASSLTFNASNWNQPQTVTVSGVDDSVVDGNIAYSVILAAAQSSDPAYNGMNPTDVSVTNTDDDAAAKADGFDFGTDASPISDTAKQVSETTWYNSAAGYGWLNGTVGSRDRGGPDAVKRDFNFTYSGAMSFGADLPAGSYQVTIVVGDEWYGTTGMQVLLEGRQVDTLSRAPGEYLTKTYLVNVTDGQLTLTLGSGSSGGALINSLMIADVIAS